MTFEDIQRWCRDNGADARGVLRGRDCFIRRSEERLPETLPALHEILHWDLQIEDTHYPTSPSDMERLVTGRMTLDVFGNSRRGG